MAIIAASMPEGNAGRTGPEPLFAIVRRYQDQAAALEMFQESLGGDTRDHRISIPGEREVFLNFGGGCFSRSGDRNRTVVRPDWLSRPRMLSEAQPPPWDAWGPRTRCTQAVTGACAEAWRGLADGRERWARAWLG